MQKVQVVTASIVFTVKPKKAMWAREWHCIFTIFKLTLTHTSSLTINWKAHHVFAQCTIYPPHVHMDENSNNGEKQQRRHTVCAVA